MYCAWVYFLIIGIKYYNMAEEKIFADGFVFKRQEKNTALIPLAPTESNHFVLGRLSVKTEDAVAWLKEHTNKDGWVSINIRKSKGGNFYCDLDTWEPDKSVVDTKKEPAVKDLPADDLPF